MSARYWVAQYISDLFRNEPRNVGVFVKVENAVACRFFGESEGQLDGRKLRAFQYPDVYRQWVDFWRSLGHGGGMDAVTKASGSHYRVCEGGSLDDANVADVTDLLSYLYALVVSEGGFREALGAPAEAEQGLAGLVQEVVEALREEEVLDTGGLFVPHPVRRGVLIPGRLEVPHRPAFVQENGGLYVMETVDFTGRKRPARDHAGWSAYMFSDIRQARPNTTAIAVVRLREEDRADEEVQNGLALLSNEGRLVNWNAANERAAFLRERREVAMAL